MGNHLSFPPHQSPLNDEYHQPVVSSLFPIGLSFSLSPALVAGLHATRKNSPMSEDKCRVCRCTHSPALGTAQLLD